MMPRRSVVERSGIAFSMTIFLETAPVKVSNSASSWRSVNAGGPPNRTFHGTGGQSGTRLYLYGRTCPASTHLRLRQIPQSPRLRRQPQRMQADESHTRPPPLAAQGGIGGVHRAGGRAGSVAGAVLCRWFARGEGLRRAVRWAQRERLLLRPRRERRVRIVRQRPRPPGWVALLRRRGQVGEEPGCHGG